MHFLIRCVYYTGRVEEAVLHWPAVNLPPHFKLVTTTCPGTSADMPNDFKKTVPPTAMCLSDLADKSQLQDSPCVLLRASQDIRTDYRVTLTLLQSTLQNVVEQKYIGKSQTQIQIQNNLGDFERLTWLFLDRISTTNQNYLLCRAAVDSNSVIKIDIIHFLLAATTQNCTPDDEYGAPPPMKTPEDEYH